MFTWKAGTTEAQERELRAGLAALPGFIADIRSYRFGTDAGIGAGNDHFAVVATFDDADGYQRYLADPHHLDVVERLVKPILATRHAIQFAAS